MQNILSSGGKESNWKMTTENLKNVKKSVLKYNIWYTKKQVIQYSVFSVAKLFSLFWLTMNQ